MGHAAKGSRQSQKRKRCGRPLRGSSEEKRRGRSVGLREGGVRPPGRPRGRTCPLRTDGHGAPGGLADHPVSFAPLPQFYLFKNNNNNKLCEEVLGFLCAPMECLQTGTGRALDTDRGGEVFVEGTRDVRAGRRVLLMLNFYFVSEGSTCALAAAASR